MRLPSGERFDVSGEGFVPDGLVTQDGQAVEAGFLGQAEPPPWTGVLYLAKYQNMNAVFKALSDPTRRRVLELLRQGPQTAGELAAQFDVSKPTMSAHFAVLREAGLIASEKNGKSVIYRLEMSVLEDALLGFARVFGWSLEAKQE